jgi:hypothetical protein
VATVAANEPPQLPRTQQVFQPPQEFAVEEPQSPTPELRNTSDVLEEAIARLANALKTCEPIGTYESDVESRLLLLLVIRHVEGVVALSRNDLALLPSAMTLARCAFETATRIAWIMHPEDAMSREVRWLAQLKTDETFYETMADFIGRLGDNSAYLEALHSIRDFRQGVEQLLPSQYEPLKKMPTVLQMLQSMNEERKYHLYAIGCQYCHGTHQATALFRKHLGTRKQFSEGFDLDKWELAFRMCWYALHSSGERILVRQKGDRREFVVAEFATRVESAIGAITIR